jgi:hypothetical protein
MISVHSRKILALVITLALAAVTTFPAYAQAITFTDRVTEPFETIITACNGEDVYLSGELLLIFHTTIDSGGGIHSKFTLVPRHVRGVGSVTGTQYKAVGGQRDHFNADVDFAPLNETFTTMFNLVSQGGSDNLQFKGTFHITINAKGEVTAFVDHFSERCIG